MDPLATHPTLAIIPAFNEEDALPDVLDALARDLPWVDVLVVDDGSLDATANVARARGVRVAQLPFNMGVGAALRTGFRYAHEHGYERAFQFDADGQHLTSEVPLLIAELDDGADLVVGSRFRSGDGHYEVRATRGLAMGILRSMVRVLSGQRFTDTSSGFRAFSRPMITYFARNYSRDYLGDTVEALVTAVYRGHDVREVAVTMAPRSAGVPSNRSLRLAYHYVRLLSVLTLTFSRPTSRAKHREAARS